MPGSGGRRPCLGVRQLGAPTAPSARRRAWLSTLSLLLLCACLSRAATAHELKAAPAPRDLGISPAPRLPVIKRAPDFTLRDTADRPVHLSALRGRAVLLSFIYTQCSVACPLVTQRMVRLHDRLVRAGLRRTAVFLTVSVDPERDSARVLERYAAHFGGPRAGWKFLRDEPDRVRRVLEVYDEWTRPQPDGGIDHPARIYLIDPRGDIREIYSLSFFDERQAFVDIRALAREFP
ncbi:MAG: hypothetical protein DME17_17225 [Candidatus Rokuibacteriota bacterium]|nr:MAG: hypothetical protein DME17_17225 [Candidatus Rokubacteria bacterium]